jgi:hypothetical protein
MNRSEFIQSFVIAGEVTREALTELSNAIGVPAVEDVAAIALDGALLEFSQDSPKVATIAGTWAGAAVPLTGWYERSALLTVESPTGAHPPTYVDSSLIELDTDAGTVYLSISTGVLYKVRYTILHTIPTMPTGGATPTDISIPASLHKAFFKLAAAGLFEMLAGKYADTVGSAFQADSVNHQTKTGEYLRLAKEARTRYRLLLGLPEKPSLEYAGFGVELDQADYRTFPESSIWPT